MYFINIKYVILVDCTRQLGFLANSRNFSLSSFLRLSFRVLLKATYETRVFIGGTCGGSYERHLSQFSNSITHISTNTIVSISTFIKRDKCLIQLMKL